MKDTFVTLGKKKQIKMMHYWLMFVLYQLFFFVLKIFKQKFY